MDQPAMGSGMPEPFAWLMVVLMTYRVAYFTTIDNGPLHIMKRFRERIANRYGVGSWMEEGASCLFCQSVWFALPAALILHPGSLGNFLIDAGSIAGGCVIIHWMVLALMARVQG